ncbi:SPRY domain-containing SOCS box protein 3 [Denticeps clupeoides]|uniref:B30.2/SPRY domain-containing protein n=1 Tax=Denticeps clupeoides TaxID=299321 RepID=A0AAY4B1W5_9TELE|nr:SPRY domain-containing SOCS box protein 3-like [Denticeps clupeoides]
MVFDQKFVGHAWEQWHWDTKDKSPAAKLSPCQQAVYFHTNLLLESEGSAGVRGTKGFCHGEHYWEVEFLEAPYGVSVMVGVGTEKAALHTESRRCIDLLGVDGESWGLSYKGCLWHNGQSSRYTEPFYQQNTVIGVLLDLDAGALSFYRDGVSLGRAFSGMDEVGRPLYPLASSTAPETELQLGLRSCRLDTLQERCFHAVAEHLRPQAPPDSLALPRAMRAHLLALHHRA